MQMIADLHTHTLCATHAYNTFNEMAVAAKEIGYCALAVTDHAPAMPDAPHSWHFSNWSAMPHVINDVVMLYGAEANVMDTKGGLDMPESQLKDQDWVVASIHRSCVPGLLAPVRAYAENETKNITTGKFPKICACTLHNDAGVIGAAALGNSI